ncbi:hypothetical protein ABH972_005489 [Bradyrhizobium ottawaense]
MAAYAGRNIAAGIAAGGEQLALCQHVLADLARRRLRQRRMFAGKIFRHRLQIRIRQKLQQIVHGRIFAAAAAEGEQLIVEIAGGLAGKPREIDVAGAFALVAVTGRAGLDPRRHRIRRLVGRLCGRTVNGGQGDSHGDRGRGASEQFRRPPKCWSG